MALKHRSRAEDTTQKTPPIQKFFCGTGHVFNDLFLQMAVSFNLVYFIKVAELDGGQAGAILFIALMFNAIFAPIAGYCSDTFTLPLLSRAVGRRKAWHLVGVIIMAAFFPLLHTRCLVCTANSSSWGRFGYYLTLMIFVNGVAFPTMNVGHLSIISAVAKSQRESVELNVLRTMFTYMSGMVAYAVTWIMLGRDSRDALSPSSWKDFTTVNCILVCVGLIFSGAIFHVGTKEPQNKRPRTYEFFAKQGLNMLAIVFFLGEDEEMDVSSTRVRKVSRKTSFPLRKISSYLEPFDETRETAPDDQDFPLQEIIPRLTQVEEERSSRSSSRKSSTWRKISANLMPFDASLLIEDLADTSTPQEDGQSQMQEIAPSSDKAEGEDSDVTQHDTRTRTKKSSFPQKIVKACHVVETNRIPKTRKAWLKDPGLYRVCAVIAVTQLIVGAGYAYMPFYLTDYLLFRKEAIAYFPLILFVSGLCGTVASKFSDKKLGSKWTYCLAATLLIGSAAWIYFISRPIGYLIYAPVILVGASSSTMVAMALTFLTHLIGEEKETAGFVCSVSGFTTKTLAGAFYMITQNFYPSRSKDGECGECASFARHVYTLTLAAPPLLGLLIVLLFQKSSAR